MSIKNIILSLGLLVSFAGFSLAFSAPTQAGLFEQAKNEACGGAQLTGANASCAGADTSKLDNTIKFVVNLISIIIGIVAVIMILINGLKFITSAGDSNKVGSAKSGIIWAIVGLVIVGSAQFLVNFVLNKV